MGPVSTVMPVCALSPGILLGPPSPRRGTRASAQYRVTLAPLPHTQRRSLCSLAFSCSELVGEKRCQL